MEVRPGYKQTEVGVIPDEWDASRLQRASANITVGFVGSMAHLFVRDGVPLLRGQNILPQALDLSELKFVSLATHQLWKKSALLPGDVAIVRVGYPGTACVIPVGLGELNAASLVLVRPDKACIDSDYLACVLNSSWGKRQIGSLLVGGAQQVFNTRTAAAFVVPLPALPEQRAIAAALSDVDALLGGLDRLIAKKRDLKQAAMQQLLTGQTRLPGFHGEWEVKRLGETGDIRSGGTPSTTQAHFWNGDVPWCTPTDITGLLGRKYLIDTARTISRAGLQSSSAEVIPPRSLIMTSRATIGECAINLVAMTTNQGFKNIVPFPEIDVEFLYYLMTTQKAGLISLCGGSTFLEIGKKQLSAYEITLPKDRVEQSSIATVLSDMDAELTALEHRRDKTRDLKQAMMQELLTGKTRLVPAGAAHA